MRLYTWESMMNFILLITIFYLWKRWQIYAWKTIQNDWLVLIVFNVLIYKITKTPLKYNMTHFDTSQNPIQ